MSPDHTEKILADDIDAEVERLDERFRQRAAYSGIEYYLWANEN